MLHERPALPFVPRGSGVRPKGSLERRDIQALILDGRLLPFCHVARQCVGAHDRATRKSMLQCTTEGGAPLTASRD